MIGTVFTPPVRYATLLFVKILIVTDGRHFRMATVVLGSARELVRTVVMTWARAPRRDTGGDVHARRRCGMRFIP